MGAFSHEVGYAVLVLYVMLSFGIQTTMTVARHFRGAIPSLYRQPTLHGAGSLRGSAVAVTVNDMPNVNGGDESLCTGASVKVLAAVVSIITLASKITHRRWPTGMTTICLAILIAYALFSFAIPLSMSVAPWIRGGTPPLYLPPARRDMPGVLSRSAGSKSADFSSGVGAMSKTSGLGGAPIVAHGGFFGFSCGSMPALANTRHLRTSTFLCRCRGRASRRRV